MAAAPPGEGWPSLALGVASGVLATMGRLPAVAQVVPAARATPTTATTVRHDGPRVSRRLSPDPAPTEVSLTVWSMSSIDTGASPPTTWCGWRPSAKRSPDGVTAHLQEGAHLSPHSDPRVKWAHAERGFAGHLRGWLDSTSGTIVGRFVYKPPPSTSWKSGSTCSSRLCSSRLSSTPSASSWLRHVARRGA